MSCWQSAPADIICDIGERLFDTNDLDSYVAMRGVCSIWRQAIAPPIESGEQGGIEILRVRPHRWIVLEEDIDKQIFGVNEEGIDRVLVNLFTGRMVKRRLSMLSDHIFVGSSDRLFILIEKNEPHLVKLWEPFTGYHVQLAAGIINEHLCHFAVETRGVPRLFYNPGDYGSPRVMCCDIDNGCLEVLFCDMPVDSVASMTTYKSDVFVLFRNRRLFKITGSGYAVRGELILIYKAPESEYMSEQCLVVSEYNLLLVVPGITQLLIFYVDVEQRTAERIYNLGCQTLFVGFNRCISVDARKFSGVRKNCLYLVCISPHTRQYKISEYHLTNSQKLEFFQPFTEDIPYALEKRPYSVPQVLMNYALFQDRRKRQLFWI